MCKICLWLGKGWNNLDSLNTWNALQWLFQFFSILYDKRDRKIIFPRRLSRSREDCSKGCPNKSYLKQSMLNSHMGKTMKNSRSQSRQTGQQFRELLKWPLCSLASHWRVVFLLLYFHDYILWKNCLIWCVIEELHFSLC